MMNQIIFGSFWLILIAGKNALQSVGLKYEQRFLYKYKNASTKVRTHPQIYKSASSPSHLQNHKLTLAFIKVRTRLRIYKVPTHPHIYDNANSPSHLKRCKFTLASKIVRTPSRIYKRANSPSLSHEANV